VYGPRAVGVVLTGNLDDGTAGLWRIKQLSGITVAQDPADAMFPSMPASAINHVRADHVLPLSEIPDLLVRLATEPVDAALAGTVPESLEVEVKIAKEQNPLEVGLQQIANRPRLPAPNASVCCSSSGRAVSSVFGAIPDTRIRWTACSQRLARASRTRCGMPSVPSRKQACS
jgi:hypothetical protein